MSNIVDLTGDLPDSASETSDLEEVRVVRLPQNDVQVVSSRRIPREERRRRLQPDMPSLGGYGVRDHINDFDFSEMLAHGMSRDHEQEALRAPRAMPLQQRSIQDFHPEAYPPSIRLAPGHAPHPFYPHHGGFFFGPHYDGANPILQHVLARSIVETHNHQEVDVEKIRKPPKGETTPGYTRDLNSKAQLCCPRCLAELGTGDERRSKVFFRSCGHCYCGDCVEQVKQSRGKRRACSAEGCRTKKRITFTQIYF